MSIEITEEVVEIACSTNYRLNGELNWPNLPAEFKQKYEVAMRAALTAVAPLMQAKVPDGWKLVPIEPTHEMLAAAQGENVIRQQRQLPRFGTLRRKWSSMLAAAPEVQS